MRRFACAVLFVVASGFGTGWAAQVSQPTEAAAAGTVAVATNESAVLRYVNRPITVFRGSILSRTPQERAAAAVASLDRLMRQGSSTAISTRPLLDSTVVEVGGHDVFMLTPQDVDRLSDETLDSKVSETVANLQLALAERLEAKTTRRMLVDVGQALVGLAVFATLLLGAKRLHGRLATRLPTLAEREMAKLWPGDVLVRESHVGQLLGRAVNLALALVVLVIGYGWLTFTLRRFPYTRPYGESLRTFLLSRVATLGVRVLDALPDLFMVVLIVAVTRFFVRLCNLFFQAVEEQRIAMPGLYPETAYATRRLVSILLWLLALLVTYPYLPGSNSDVFKGISVLVGLVISLSSSGLVNQVMSGLLITYSRAVRIDDFVKIGDVEGTVMQIGALSTKVKTHRGEEVTIPNAIVVANVTLNYSRFAETDGVYVPTMVSIGYDTPWRQVQALLLLAADRTPHVCRQPSPIVRQSSLGDFCVEYTLLVCVEKPRERGATLSALHANILDAFNDAGVQIMSPHYEVDPDTPKLVPRARWYSPPAASPITDPRPAAHRGRT